MATITFITGGARSGKSSYAQERALAQSISPVYVATAKVWDDSFQKRVDRHRNDRNERWRTFEQMTNLSHLPLQKETVVIDCVTLWLTNLFAQEKNNIEKCLQLLKSDMEALLKTDNHFFIVSNEIGMGLHAHTEVGLLFTDLQGWANQYIASVAKEVVFMVSGIPLHIKRPG